MALYRCAACGSPNVVTDTQKEGYSYVKGAIGTVVLGVGGAAAGINGKTKTVYKCPDCGLTLNYSMPFEIKALIDMGVSVPSSRPRLNLNGIPIDWKSFTSKYRNIEKDTVGAADAASTNIASTSESVAPALPAEEVALYKIIYKVAKANYVSKCVQWVEECKAIRKHRDALVNQLLEEGKSKLLAEITATRDAQLAEHNQKKQQYVDEKSAAESKLSTLGLFQFGEKSDTKKRIAELTRLILQEYDALKAVNAVYEQDAEDAETSIEQQRPELQQHIAAQNPLPSKPQKLKGMLAFTENGGKTSAQDFVTQSSIEEIFRFIEEKGFATYTQIKEGCKCCVGMTDTYISAWIDALMQDEEIHKIGPNYKITVAPHPDWAFHPRVTEEDWIIYETYTQQEAERQAQLEKQRNEQFAAILNAMKGKGPMSMDEIIKSSPDLRGYSEPKLFPILCMLVEQGTIVKRTIRRRYYYEYE